MHGEPPHNKSTQSVSYQDKRNRKRKRECTENTVKGKSCIDDFQIENFGDIRDAFTILGKFFFLTFCLSFESMNDKKR